MAKQQEDPDVLGRALRKTENGYGTTATEKQAIHDYERGAIGRDYYRRIPDRPVSKTYKPLGATPKQLSERIHTLQDPRAGGANVGFWTFTACVDGEPKDFVIPILSGPTDPA